MASIEEFRTNLAQQKANIESGRQSAVAARQEISEYRTAEQPTASQLLARGRFEALQSKAEEKQRTTAKETAAGQVTAYEAELAKAEQQIGEQEGQLKDIEFQQSEYDLGRKAAQEGRPQPHSSKYASQGYRDIILGQRWADYKIDKQSALNETETKPVLVPTQLLTNIPMFAGGMKDTSGFRPPVKQVQQTQTFAQKARDPFGVFGKGANIAINVGVETPLIKETKFGSYLGTALQIPSKLIELKKQRIGSEAQSVAGRLGLTDLSLSVRKPTLTSLYQPSIAVLPSELKRKGDIVIGKLSYGSATTTGITAAQYLFPPTAIVSISTDLLSKGGKVSKGERLEKGEFIQAGVEAGILGYVGYKEITKPIISYREPVSKAKISVQNIIQPKVKNGVQIEEGLFKLKAEIPARYGEQTTALRNFIGKPPKLIILSKPQTYSAYTFGFEPKGIIDALGKKPIITKSGKIINEAGFAFIRQGAKTGKTFELSGTSSELSVADWGTLTKQQKTILQGIASDRAGIPVSLKNTPKMLGKDFSYSVGYPEGTVTGKIKYGKTFADLNPVATNIPKVVSRGEVISSSKMLAKSETGTELWKGTIGIKDVTMPTSRGITIAKETTIVKPVIDITPDATDLNIFNPTGKGGSTLPLYSTEQKSILKADTKSINKALGNLGGAKAKAISLIPKQAVNIPVVTTTRGGLYAGLGLYELSGMNLGIQQGDFSEIGSGFAFRRVLGEGSGTGMGLNTKSTITLDIGNISDVGQKQAQPQALKTLQAPALASIQLPQLGSIQLPKVQQQSAQRSSTTQLYRGGGESTPIWKLIKQSIPAKKLKGSLFDKKKSKAFQLFIKRRGREVLIGKPTTRGRALRTGENIARVTLARTFGLKPSGTTELEDISYTPSQMFRGYQIKKGKKIPLQDTFIQRARFSLSSLGEKREIKSSRRKKWI